MRWVFIFKSHSSWRWYHRRISQVWYSCSTSSERSILSQEKEYFQPICLELYPFLRITMIIRWSLGFILVYWYLWGMIDHRFGSLCDGIGLFSLDGWSGLRRRRINRCRWRTSLIIAIISEIGCLFSLAIRCFSLRYLICPRNLRLVICY